MASENEKPDDALLGALKAALDYAGTPPPPRCPECARLKNIIRQAESNAYGYAMNEELPARVSVLRARGDEWEGQIEAAINASDSEDEDETILEAVRRLKKERDAALATAQARDEEAGRLRNLLLHAVTYIAPAKDFGPKMVGPCSVCNAMISKFECEAAFLCSGCLTRQIDAALGSQR